MDGDIYTHTYWDTDLKDHETPYLPTQMGGHLGSKYFSKVLSKYKILSGTPLSDCPGELLELSLH